MNIVFCIDDHFTLPCAVALTSLIEAHREAPKIHLVSAQSADARARLEALAARLGVALRIATFARELPFQNVVMYGKTTGSAYARLFIAEIFPDLSRCLYLDADILCRHELGPLWRRDLGGHVLGAALDPTFFGVEAFLEIFGGRYFNSGVLLIDLELWRAREMTRRAIEAVQFFEANALPDQYWDQSPLNLSLRGAFTAIEPRWNMSLHHSPEMSGFYGLDPVEFEAQRRDPAIVHFLGNEKPWRPGHAAVNDHARRWHEIRAGLIEFP